MRFLQASEDLAELTKSIHDGHEKHVSQVATKMALAEAHIA